MPGQPVKIGPFVGGMNTYSGPSAIGDNEAVELVNFDIDLDGSLVSRPGLKLGSVPVAVANKIAIVLGTYRSVTDVFYIIYAFGDQVWNFNTQTSAWTKIADGDFTACLQYSDKLWLVLRPSGVTQGGGKWDPTGGYVAVAQMPRGYSACLYKERMWIAASKNADQTSINQLKFSNAANFDTWTTGTDFINVNAGDGQDIMHLRVFDSAIVIFKTDSTFIFAYDSQPAKGQVQQMNGVIGANNNFSVVEYENNLFVMHESYVYRISNWNWEQANVKVPFEYRNTKSISSALGSSVSIIGNRVMCRYYDSTYVLGTKTGGWSLWEWNNGGTTYYPTNFVGDPNVDATTGAREYYTGSYDNTNDDWYLFIDQINSEVRNESINTRLTSKAYDFGPSYSFKRLFWWGVDIISKSTVNFRVSPVVYSIPVTWGQLVGVPWTSLKTWGRPLDVSIDVTDSASSSNPSYYRVFVKLLKSLRFRQVQFILESTTDGSDATGPLRVFSLTAFVDAKENVVKQVS